MITYFHKDLEQQANFLSYKNVAVRKPARPHNRAVTAFLKKSKRAISTMSVVSYPHSRSMHCIKHATIVQTVSIHLPKQNTPPQKCVNAKLLQFTPVSPMQMQVVPFLKESN